MNTSILRVIVNGPLSLRTNGSRMVGSARESLLDLIGFSEGKVVNHINLKGCRTCPPRAKGTGEFVA